MSNANVEQSTIRLQLSLARPPQTDPAPLPLKVGPPPDQSRREMSQLSQFDLKFAFMGLRPEGKDVQNQSGPVDHTATRNLLQITFLDRRDRLINDDEMCAMRCNRSAISCAFPRPTKVLASGGPAGCPNTGYDVTARRFRKTAQLVEVGVSYSPIRR